MSDEKKPWFKFFPADWRADQALRLCSPASRGLWMECMCLMHEAKPYGHLLVNGKSLTDAQLAIQTGIPHDQITSLIGELETAGVFSRNSDGVIFSRKMTRSAKRAAINKKNGKSGGNPHLVNRPDNQADKPPVSLEARGQKLDIPKKEVIGSLTRTLKNKKPLTPSQKKAAWQSKICVWAQHRMTTDEYTKFLEAWAKGEAWANLKAEEFDKQIRAATG